MMFRNQLVASIGKSKYAGFSIVIVFAEHGLKFSTVETKKIKADLTFFTVVKT